LWLTFAQDYTPKTDLERFPREDVRFPSAEENPLGGWAWKCHIEDKTKQGGLLAGKTIAIKDNIAVKDVPMLLGTDFIKDYTPVSTLFTFEAPSVLPD
jgi:amidase